MNDCKIILSAEEISRSLDRLAYEIIERHGDCRNLALIGVQRRGADLAERLKVILDARSGARAPLGKLDINLYRDDWTTLDVQPVISCTEIPFEIDGADIILVDDVLFTGRTIRAALEAILDYGRPHRVELLVLVDRGHRELPIQADYVGKRVPTSRGERIDVFVKERDEEDKVCLAKSKAA